MWVDTSVVGHANEPCEKDATGRTPTEVPHFTFSVFSPFLWISYVSLGTRLKLLFSREKRIWKASMTAWQAEAVASPPKGLSPVRKSPHGSRSSYRSTRHNHRHRHGCRVDQCSPDWTKCERLRQLWESLPHASASQGGGNPSCSFFQLFLN